MSVKHGRLAQMLRNTRVSSNDFIRACCLFCEDHLSVRDTKWSFALHVPTGRYRCLRCGERGVYDGTVSSEMRAKAAAVKIDATEAFRPPQGFYQIDQEPAASSKLFEPARKFLDKRGIDKAKRLEAGIGATLEGRFAGRIVVPVRDEAGKWHGYVTRSWVKEHPIPYLYPNGMERAEIFYGGWELRKKTDVPLLVVEGSFDRIYLGGDSAAVLGLPSIAQMIALEDAPRPVVFVLDGDAYIKAWQCAQQLNARAIMRGCAPRFGALRLPPGFDPDEFSPEILRQAAQNVCSS